MLAVADRLMLRQAVEHLRQYFLALDQWLLSKIMPIEVEQIEDEVGHWMFGALLKRCLQGGKAALSISFEYHHFSIQDDALHGKPAELACNRSHAMRPIEPAAGV